MHYRNSLTNSYAEGCKYDHLAMYSNIYGVNVTWSYCRHRVIVTILFLASDLTPSMCIVHLAMYSNTYGVNVTWSYCRHRVIITILFLASDLTPSMTLCIVSHSRACARSHVVIHSDVVTTIVSQVQVSPG